MLNSFKMVKLDFYTMKSQMVSYLSLIFILILFSFMNSSITILSFNSSWFTALFVTSVFAVQEKNELERLYSSLAIGIKNIVKGRYYFIYLNYFFNFFLTLFINLVFSIVRKEYSSMQDVIMAISVSLLIFTLITGTQLPIFFKFGYMKAKFWGMFPYILVMLLFLLISFNNYYLSIISNILDNRLTIAFVFIVFSIFIINISYKASVICYRKRNY